MKSQIKKNFCQSFMLALAAVVLTGCSAPTVIPAKSEDNNAEASKRASNNKLEASLIEQKLSTRRRFVDDLLAQPLASDTAAQLALLNGPALQTVIGQKSADTAQAIPAGRSADPKLASERARSSAEPEISRSLPGQPDAFQRAISAIEQLEQTQRAWVRAVAAKQSLHYAGQVQRSAQASAELARRMQQVGNFSKLQRARQQAFYADATAQLAASQHWAIATREELVRQLGLSAGQAGKMQLPERLPELPAQPRAASMVSANAAEQRFDLQIARGQLEQAGRSQGLNLVDSLIENEADLRSETIPGSAPPPPLPRSSNEPEIGLPIFDWDTTRREAMDEQSLAAAQYYDSTVHRAASELRESYSAYRTAYDVARHFQGEIVPLRKLMADENGLLYNGMFISVFDLLAGLREQIASVVAAIDAVENFWLADAALAASVAGKFTAVGSRPTPGFSGSGAAAHPH